MSGSSAERQRADEDRQLRVMIESMSRAGCSERQIVAAVEQAKRPARCGDGPAAPPPQVSSR